MTAFIEAMRKRELIAQVTHEEEFDAHCGSGTRTAYIGFDPTADSLHVGHLTQLMMLKRWQDAGHRVIATMGGGTALIGDPTGKTEMRSILSQEQIDHNIERFKAQVRPLVDFSDPLRGVILNNAEWLSKLNYLDFLTDIGRHFSVNRMLSAECFKARMEKGLSFLEFNYMLLQAYDFLHLCRNEDCTVQMGGDDQWSNILAGVELNHRVLHKQTYCMTIPLLTTSDGKKMGKTENGAIWIDPSKTSSHDYYQFWRNIPDDNVSQCLRVFTELPLESILKLDQLQGAELNEAKSTLAFECTKLIHGADAAQKARQTAVSLFSGGNIGETNEPIHEISQQDLGEGLEIIEVLFLSKIFSSKSEARRLIQQGGLQIEGKKINDPKYLITKELIAGGDGVLVRKGKKHYYRLRIY
jgi:tyrosyl-tRNA synthetase